MKINRKRYWEYFFINQIKNYCLAFDPINGMHMQLASPKYCTPFLNVQVASVSKQ